MFAEVQKLENEPLELKFDMSYLVGTHDYTQNGSGVAWIKLANDQVFLQPAFESMVPFGISFKSKMDKECRKEVHSQEWTIDPKAADFCPITFVLECASDYHNPGDKNLNMSGRFFRREIQVTSASHHKSV